jgi:hypothetical protein
MTDISATKRKREREVTMRKHKRFNYVYSLPLTRVNWLLEFF